MGAERKTVRIFVDVAPGFDPNQLNWSSQGHASSHMTPPANTRRLWFEVEVPSDIEIWPALFNSGLCLGRAGRRVLVGDDDTPDPNADARIFGESPQEPRPAANEVYAEEPRRSPRPDRRSHSEINRTI